MTLKDQTPEEKAACLVRIGTIYQRTDCTSAAVIVSMGDADYQFADPRVLTHLILKHCSEKHPATHTKGREE